MISQLVLQYQYTMARDACRCSVGVETKKFWEDEIARMLALGIELSDDIDEVSAIEAILLKYRHTPTFIISKLLDASTERVVKIRANLNAWRANRPKVYDLDGGEEEGTLDAYFG